MISLLAALSKPCANEKKALPLASRRIQPPLAVSDDEVAEGEDE